MAFSKKMPQDRELDSFIKAGLNVLFEGRHGVGKTSKVKAAFERNFTYTDDDGNEKPGRINQEWLYFSAATLDPWADLVGVPRPVEVEIDGKKTEILDFVRPRALALASVRGIMFDELNRAHKKVRNAVMELLQFGTINGNPMPNLEVIWAAINPEEDDDLEFDVEALDPAQKDRFEVQIEIPYKPDEGYLSSEYGNSVAKAACDWWNSLPDNVKLEVSPRRLEYAIKANRVGLSLRSILPQASNPNKLHQSIRSGIPDEEFAELMKSSNIDEARKWLGKENNYEAVKDRIVKDDASRQFAMPLLDQEKLISLVSSHREIQEDLFSNPATYKDIIEIIANGGQNIRLKKRAKEALEFISENNDQSIENLDLGTKELPKSLSGKKKDSLVSDYEIVDKGYEMYESETEFSGNFDTAIRKIAHFCRISAVNNYYRTRVFEELEPLITKPDMSEVEAKACLSVLEFYASRSNPNTIFGNQNYHRMVNTVIHNLREADPTITTQQVFDLAPYIFYIYYGHNSSANHKNYSKITGELIIKPKGNAVSPKQRSNSELEEMSI